MKKSTIFSVMGLLVLLNACKSKEVIPPVPVSSSYTFESGLEGWQAGFADYMPAQEESMELQAARSLVPDNLSPRSYSVLLSGDNHSDDLFMFLKKQFTGLQPNQTYQLTYELIMVSQYPQNSVGAGGSPGASVAVKAGASQVEPARVLNEGHWRMNIDQGGQGNPGRDMQVLGTMGIAGDAFVNTRITRTNQATPMRVQADATGKLWLIVGTDSGFEGHNVVYYDEIKVNFQPVTE